MKKMILLVLVFFAMLVFNGCTFQSKPNQLLEDKKISKTNEEQTSEDKKNNDINELSSYYGEWEITKIAAYAPVSADGEDSVEKLFGKRIILNKNYFQMENNIYNNAKYEIKRIERYEFERGYRIKFADLGIDNDFIIKVIVYDGDKYTENDEWKDPIRVFFIKDEDNLLLWAVDILEMKRTKP